MFDIDDTDEYMPEVVEFGPFRVIGMRYAGKNENGEIAALWHNEEGIMSRIDEIVKPADFKNIAFGICRCLPGATDESIEYIAGFPTTIDAPIPDGMVDAQIASGTYVVYPTRNIHEIMLAFEQFAAWLEYYPEWINYCNDDSCECHTHPSFELYPESFCNDGKLFVYIPIHKK